MDSWKFVDKDLRILSSTMEGIPPWVRDQFLTDTEHSAAEELTFFYHPGADAVVLNESHKCAEFYELLVTVYLGVEEEQRIRLKQNVPVESMGTSLELLDYIIRRRGNNGRS